MILSTPVLPPHPEVRARAGRRSQSDVTPPSPQDLLPPAPYLHYSPRPSRATITSTGSFCYEHLEKSPTVRMKRQEAVDEGDGVGLRANKSTDTLCGDEDNDELNEVKVTTQSEAGLDQNENEAKMQDGNEAGVKVVITGVTSGASLDNDDVFRREESEERESGWLLIGWLVDCCVLYTYMCVLTSCYLIVALTHVSPVLFG